MTVKKLFLPVLLLVSFSSFGQPFTPSYLPTDGLVGWWPFNGNANDMSGYNNHGTPINTALTTDRFGNLNAAYLFNGIDSRIDVADAASLRCRAITLSAWFYCTDISKTNQIIYKGSMNAEGEAYSLTLFPDQPPASGVKINSGCITAEGWKGVGSKNQIDTSKWIHLAATFDGAVYKIYKNGVLDSSAEIAGLIDSCIGGGLRFGYDHLRYFASTGDPFHGTIDDIGIWNRALTEQEITSLFTGSADCGYGKMGINVCNPQRNFHIKDVLRLEPRNTAPDNPGKGDIYFDGVTNKLRVYDGTQWQDCW